MKNEYKINSKCFDKVRAFLMANHVNAADLTNDNVLAYCADAQALLDDR